MFENASANLSWLAFQYVSEDLSATEAASFEERLATDQAAREAVAEAMLLLQAVSAGAKIEGPAPARRSWLQPAAWAAVGAAACLAVVFALRSTADTEPVAAKPQAADISSAELALVWARTGELDGSSPMAEVAPEEDLGLAIDGREAERDFVVPAWMLEALSTPQEASPAPKASQES